MLHPKKREGIIELFNGLKFSSSASTLTEFSDGLLFYQLIFYLIEESKEVVPPVQGKCDVDPIETNDIVHPQNIPDPVVQNELRDINSELAQEVADIQNSEIHSIDYFNEKNSVSACETNAANGVDTQQHQTSKAEDEDIPDSLSVDIPVADSCEIDTHAIETQREIPANDTHVTKMEVEIPDIPARYEVIKNFIKNMLGVECETFVDYDNCISGVEIELAKFAVLFLSSVVEYALSSRRSHIIGVTGHIFEESEEIVDILKLFLMRGEKEITKKYFEVVLSRPAKQRRNSARRKVSHYVCTPQQYTRSSRRAQSMTSEYSDDVRSPLEVFQNSPLRKSPQEIEARLLNAVRLKDKEIVMLTYDLDTEKFNVEELKKQNQELNSQLSRSKVEMNKLKAELQESRDACENQAICFDKEKLALEEEIKRLEKQIQELESDVQFWKEKEKEPSETTEKVPHCCSFDKKLTVLEFTIQANEAEIKSLRLDNEFKDQRLAKLEWDKKELEMMLEDTSLPERKSSPPEQKTFNVTDMATRNKLRDDEMQASLLSQQLEFDAKMQKMEEKLLEKDQSVKEWMAKFRKADKDREDTTRSLEKKMNKLKTQVTKLETENKVYRRIGIVSNHHSTEGSVFTNTVENSSDANETMPNSNIRDSEKIGELWSKYSEEPSPPRSQEVSNTAETMVQMSSSLCPYASSRSESDSVCLSQNRQSFSGSSSEVSSTHRNNTDCLPVEKSPSISNGRLSCTEGEFHKIRSLVINLTKFVRVKNNLKSDVASNLQSFEKNLNSVKDLISALTLFNKVIMSGVATCSPPLKRRRGSPDLHQEENWQELREENKKLKSEIDILKQQVTVCEKSVQEKATSTVEPDASDGERKANDSTSNEEDPLHQCQKSLDEYKAKSENLELKIKIMGKKFAVKEKKYQEQLTLAHYMKDSHIEKYKKVALERESLLKKVRELEPIAAKNNSNKPIPLNRACDQCGQLAEKLRLCKLDREATEKTVTYLKDDLQNARNEISALNHRLKSLMLEIKKLESELENEKCWKYAQSDPSILKFTEGLRIKDALEQEKNSEGRENESKSEDEGDSVQNFENSSFHVISKNESTCTTPSVKNLTNGTGKTLKAFCKPEDEAEMFSQSYLGEIQRESPTERMKEFQRRNTLCLPHLKSAYPLELNTTPSQDKYFMPPTSLKRQRIRESASATPVVKRCKVFKHTESLKCSRTEAIPWKSVCAKHRANGPSDLLPSSTQKEKGSFSGRMHMVRNMMKLQKSKIK